MRSVLLLVSLICHGSYVISSELPINSRAGSTRTEVRVEENWNTNQLTFEWDGEYFAKHFDATQNYVMQFIVYVSDGFEPVFTPSSIVQLVGANSGSATVTVSASNIARLSNVRFPYFYVLKPVGTKTSMYLSSVLLAPTLGMTESLARETCSAWNDIAKIPTPVNTDVISCPPCLCQMQRDPNFVQTNYDSQIIKLTNGELNEHVLFNEKAYITLGGYQTCSYDLLTGELAVSSPPRAAWLNHFNKFSSYKENFNDDVWPYIVCCLQSNSKEYCDSFHVKRPISRGEGYPESGKLCDEATCTQLWK